METNCGNSGISVAVSENPALESQRSVLAHVSVCLQAGQAAKCHALHTAVFTLSLRTQSRKCCRFLFVLAVGQRCDSPRQEREGAVRLWLQESIEFGGSGL